VRRTAFRAGGGFLARATHWLASERGIRQFLDISPGAPGEPSVHRIARAVAPEAKVVYCDGSPAVCRHAQALPHGTPEGGTAYVRADVTDPESILDAPGLSDTIDLGRPVALSADGLLHLIGDEQRPYDIVRTLLGALPADSCLVLTHGTHDLPGGTDAGQGRSRLHLRSHGEISRFFDGLELARPGLVAAHRWRPDGASGTGSGAADLDGPDSGSTSVPCYAGVARKP
jgi:S-adenosyl methyltransferase